MTDMPKITQDSKYVVCLSNEGYPASLVVRRIYQIVSDSKAAEHGLLRVRDETGEDYLFPQELFEPIDLPTQLRRKLALTT
jgi:hypothetical protein